MEREGFDQLAKLFAARQRRRDVFKYLAGGMLGGAVAARFELTGAQGDCDPPCGVAERCSEDGQCVGVSDIAVCAGEGQSCENVGCCGDLECTEINPGEPICFDCIEEGEPCETIGCCQGLVCNETMTACVPAECEPELSECQVDADCCDGLECTEINPGQPICFDCIEEGEPCETIGCCKGLVCNETMTACVPEGCEPELSECQVDADCCDDLECTEINPGQPICFDCIKEGDPCETIGCCKGLVCNETMTACVPACETEGSECADDADCCDGLQCDRRGICVGVCGLWGDPCELVPGSCCDPYTCFEAVCDIPRGCVETGHPCVGEVPCCDDQPCVAGICGGEEQCGVETCGLSGDSCEYVPGSCCDPYTCFEGICDIPKGCVDPGHPCVSNFPCCDDAPCHAGRCAGELDITIERTCAGFTETCELVEGSCCDPYTCFEGQCDIPKGCVDPGHPCVPEFPCCEDTPCLGGYCGGDLGLASPDTCSLGGEECEQVAGSCCDPYTCFEGICDIPKGCVDQGHSCVDGYPCCDGAECVDGRCSCDMDDGQCGWFGDACEMVEGSCCSPFTCFEAQCDIPKGCVDPGLPCVAEFPCCDGAACEGGMCAAPPAVCAGFGEVCEMVEGSCCLPYTCFEGQCDIPKGCVDPGLPCVPEFPCCDGGSCVDGVCSEPTPGCAGFAETCEMVAGSCCEPYTCFEGQCDIPKGCVDPGLPCVPEFACCDGGVCVEGLCSEPPADCAGFGEACEMVEGSCCSPFTCFEAQCDIPKGCVDPGLPCVAEFPCCEDASCQAGVCGQPPRLSG